MIQVYDQGSLLKEEFRLTAPEAMQQADVAGREARTVTLHSDTFLQQVYTSNRDSIWGSSVTMPEPMGNIYYHSFCLPLPGVPHC